MANIISDETIEYVGILAKLALSDEEKAQAKKDMGRMLDYIDKLNVLTSLESLIQQGLNRCRMCFPCRMSFGRMW